MAHTGNLLQKMKVVSGVQCTDILAITSSALGPKSHEGQERLLKEERREQSAAAD